MRLGGTITRIVDKGGVLTITIGEFDPVDVYLDKGIIPFWRKAPKVGEYCIFIVDSQTRFVFNWKVRML